MFDVFCKGLCAPLAGPVAPIDALCLYHLHSSCAACLYKPVMQYDGSFSAQNRPRVTDPVAAQLACLMRAVAPCSALHGSCIC